MPPSVTRWIVPEQTEHSPFDQVLANRGVTDRDRFLHPDYERDSYDPFLLPTMDVAVDRIIRALQQHEVIAVYTDYDADGIPGGALLIRALRANGATVVPYIPDRAREGYGLNEPAIEALKQRGVGLIITVDLGITNQQAVAAAARSGIDVIVTDHHAIDPARIPTDAVATVHPALSGSTYPFHGLAGGAVAWKLVQALALRTGRPSGTQLKWWIDLPAISTVCDLVPLIDESRLITHFGLKVLRKTRSVGLRAIYASAAIDQTSISERTIGFQIGPRINAPGRMDHANPSLELLLTDDAARASELADEIERRNRERQMLVDRVVSEATDQLMTTGPDLPPVIVLGHADWPIGVLGLAASRLADRWYRPVVLLQLAADGSAKGSARSIDEFNILQSIAEQRHLLTSFGGHTAAAGLALAAGTLTDFHTGLVGTARRLLTTELLTRVHRADVALSPTQVTSELHEQLELLAPFGVANPSPRFVIRPLIVRSVRRLGSKAQHLKLTFANASFPALAWRSAERSMGEPTQGESIAVLGRLEWNVWNGQRSLQVIMDDWRPADLAASV